MRRVSATVAALRVKALKGPAAVAVEDSAAASRDASAAVDRALPSLPSVAHPAATIHDGHPLDQLSVKEVAAASQACREYAAAFTDGRPDALRFITVQLKVTQRRADLRAQECLQVVRPRLPLLCRLGRTRAAAPQEPGKQVLLSYERGSGPRPERLAEAILIIPKTRASVVATVRLMSPVAGRRPQDDTPRQPGAASPTSPATSPNASAAHPRASVQAWEVVSGRDAAAAARWRAGGVAQLRAAVLPLPCSSRACSR
jgi:hypothetical protein